MNHIEKVAEILGVEIGEVFDIKRDDGTVLTGCAITRGGLYDVKSPFYRHAQELNDLLCGTASVIKVEPRRVFPYRGC